MRCGTTSWPMRRRCCRTSDSAACVGSAVGGAAATRTSMLAARRWYHRRMLPTAPAHQLLDDATASSFGSSHFGAPAGLQHSCSVGTVIDNVIGQIVSRKNCEVAFVTPSSW